MPDITIDDNDTVVIVLHPEDTVRLRCVNHDAAPQFDLEVHQNYDADVVEVSVIHSDEDDHDVVADRHAFEFDDYM